MVLCHVLPVLLTSGNDLSDIASSDNIAVVTNIITAIWTWITSNPLLTLFLFLGLVGSVIGVFKGLKRTAK